MSHRVVAASLVAIWFALLGIELLQDAGLVKYAAPDIVESVQATLASFGRAIPIFEDDQAAAQANLTTLSSAYTTRRQSFLFQQAGKERELLKEGVPIYKLQHVFLI